MGVLDWLSDTGLFGGQSDPMAQAGAAASANMGATPPPMPPVQMTGSDVAALNPPQPNPGAMAPPVDPSTQGAPAPPSTAMMPPPAPPIDPSTQGSPAPPATASMPPAVPLPQPRPPGAAGGAPPPAPSPPLAPAAAPPPGPPLNITTPAQNGPQPPPGFNPSILGRAFGVTSADQAAKYGQQMGSGLAQGLKAVGTNWNKPGLAAFAGTAGAAMEGGEKRADLQTKQAADYLKTAIDAKKAGDEAGYKQNYLQYLAAKLKADTDKAADKTAANKNDTPTQLYLSAQRLVQNDPEVVDARKALENARKNGEPADVTAATNRLQQVLQQKQAEHLAGVGLHPQTAAQLAKQPGNAQENPINGKTAGLTPENIGKKLQPGQWFTNPSDGKLLQYKGPPKKDESSKAPSAPTDPGTSKAEPRTAAGVKKKNDEDDDDEE